MIAIALENVSKRYKEGMLSKGSIALNGLNLNVNKGEVFGLLGPNGAGKTTAIKILLNFIRPDSGRAYIMGMDVNNIDTHKLIGYLPENPYLYDHLTAEELLWFGGRASGLEYSVIKDRIRHLLEIFDLIEVKDKSLRSYSKGMVQRVSFALAMINDPDILLLDEPMNGLDPLGRKKFVDIIVKMKERGKTILISSHILNDIEKLCNRFGIVVNGRLGYISNIKDMSDNTDLENIFLKVVEDEKNMANSNYNI
jgi:ABC-2 type transport system ATP-binding protein